MKVSVKRIAGDEADHLLVQSDRYMAALYPAESNHLVSSASYVVAMRYFWALLQTKPQGMQPPIPVSVALQRGFIPWRAMPKLNVYLLMKVTEGTQ